MPDNRHKSVQQELDEIFEMLCHIQETESSFERTLDHQAHEIKGLTEALAGVNEKLDALLEALITPTETVTIIFARPIPITKET